MCYTPSSLYIGIHSTMNANSARFHGRGPKRVHILESHSCRSNWRICKQRNAHPPRLSHRRKLQARRFFLSFESWPDRTNQQKKRGTATDLIVRAVQRQSQCRGRGKARRKVPQTMVRLGSKSFQASRTTSTGVGQTKRKTWTDPCSVK